MLKRVWVLAGTAFFSLAALLSLIWLMASSPPVVHADLAEITISTPLTFTSANTTSPGRGDWLGIILEDDSGGDIIQHSVIEYARTGVKINDEDDVCILSNTFRYNGGSGPLIASNALCSVPSFELRNDDSAPIDAPTNWWSTNTPTEA
jgi:hypothetical protein